VTAEVVNVGGRAIDMSGQLVLTDGPGSLSAGPFAAELGTTLAPGATAPVTIVLDGSLPDGPWHAKLDLRSGLLERTAEADLTFPERGMAAAPVDVEVSWWKQWGIRAALGVGAAVLLALLAVRVARGTRRAPAGGRRLAPRTGGAIGWSRRTWDGRRCPNETPAAAGSVRATGSTGASRSTGRP
jgi:hypothetical protein